MAKDAKKETKTPLAGYITDFLIYCEIEKNQSQLTVRNYGHYLERFRGFASRNGVTDPRSITLDLIRNYRLYLNRFSDEQGKPLKLITQNYHVIAVRAFLKYLIKRDVKTLSPEKIELAKNPARQVSVLDNEELERMFSALTTQPDQLLQTRDRAILLTLFSTGLRISELVSLQRKQVNLKRGEFTVRGKGDKLRLVFLSEGATTAIQSYLKLRTDNHPALFVSHTKIGQSVTMQMEAQGQSKTGGLTARSVQRLIKKYAMLAGITHPVSPHTFRHSFATDLLQNGADIRSVQTMLGHASITTTQIYTHITNAGLRDIHRKYHNKKSR